MRQNAETLPDLTLARSALDRSSMRRAEPDLVSSMLADPATCVLEMRDGSCEVVTRGGATTLHLRSPAVGDSTRLGVFLGQDGEGTAYVGVVAPSGQPTDGDDTRQWRTLREVGVTLDDRDAGLFTCLLALANWHAVHTHCPRCGAPTQAAQAGWLRRCPVDASEHYPRTDPAVIMSVTDDSDRLLLARGPQWPEENYSVLAGFVEPGESLEAAVVREVREEVGLVVGDVRYLGNQPWPFPSSLMVGFTARALLGSFHFADREIVEARWVTRAELADGLEQGAIRISSRLSIARALVEHWYGGPLRQVTEQLSVRG